MYVREAVATADIVLEILDFSLELPHQPSYCAWLHDGYVLTFGHVRFLIFWQWTEEISSFVSQYQDSHGDKDEVAEDCYQRKVPNICFEQERIHEKEEADRYQGPMTFKNVTEC